MNVGAYLHSVWNALTYVGPMRTGVRAWGDPCHYVAIWKSALNDTRIFYRPIVSAVPAESAIKRRWGSESCSWLVAR